MKTERGQNGNVDSHKERKKEREKERESKGDREIESSAQVQFVASGLFSSLDRGSTRVSCGSIRWMLQMMHVPKLDKQALFLYASVIVHG